MTRLLSCTLARSFLYYPCLAPNPHVIVIVSSAFACLCLLGTYRFLSVFQQTAIIIGEAKHGLWRLQNNGFIREYRRFSHIGLDQNLDPNSENLTAEQLEILNTNYNAFIPGKQLCVNAVNAFNVNKRVFHLH